MTIKKLISKENKIYLVAPIKRYIKSNKAFGRKRAELDMSKAKFVYKEPIIVGVKDK